MARMMIGVTEERRRVVIRARGEIGNPSCELNPDDCCDDTPRLSPAFVGCCPYGEEVESIEAVVVGALGANGESCTVYITLLINEITRLAWSGEGIAEAGGGCDGVSVELTIYCYENEDGDIIWVGEGRYRNGVGSIYIFDVIFDDFDGILTAVLTVPEYPSSSISIAIERPCPDIAQFTADTCDCSFICLEGVPEHYEFEASGATEDFIGINGLWAIYHNAPCKWIGRLSDWAVVMELRGDVNDTDPLLTFTNSSTGKVVIYELGGIETGDCCGLIEGFEAISWVGIGNKPTIDEMTNFGDCGPCTTGTGTGDGVLTSCCPENLVPNILTLTIDGCPCRPSPMTLTYNAVGANGAGWYTTSASCEGASVYYFWHCQIDDTWLLTEYRNTVANGTGSGEVIVCSPFNYEGTTAFFGTACPITGNFTVTA